MANYNCMIRTNYFRVKDEDAFRQLMSKVQGYEDAVHLFEEKTKDGQHTLFGFGAYCNIIGVIDDADIDEDGDYDDDEAYQKFVSGLQECVAEDDAIIIMESGHEKLRYVVGDAHIITSKDECYMNVKDLAVQMAKALLNNPDWTTKAEY